ncbi:hypothetical protein SAMN02745174_00672 [Cetobacterium ceti]|uniref:DUF4168 domain-containing protein n=1 Tax=Cetobacterium ceti TaxID=180163 RepID=A0A1T4KZ49_9FUSO|nr:hypothetical protein [Cetobacterium ceti]SJZ47587.1 hypothetical protein SAMN02745174_00672 [Cetobacterium ceti]
MKKVVTLLFFLLVGISTFAEEGLGIIGDQDFKSVGVSQENIDNVKKIINEASSKYKMLVLDKKSIEIEVNKCILDGAEKNLPKLDELADKLGNIEAQMIKDKFRYQIAVQKYISTEQYIKAREIAIQRLQKLNDQK